MVFFNGFDSSRTLSLDMLSTGSLYDGTDGTVLCAEKVVALKALKLALTPHSLSLCLNAS